MERYSSFNVSLALGTGKSLMSEIELLLPSGEDLGIPMFLKSCS